MQAATEPCSAIWGKAVAHTEGLNYTTEWWASDFLTGGSASTVTSTTVKLVSGDDIDHHFTASIYTDSGGAPGTLVGSFSTITLAAGAGPANYTGTSAGISLAAGTTYWEVLRVNEDLNSGGSGWLHTSSNATDAGSVFTTVPATQVQFSGDSGTSWLDSDLGTPCSRLMWHQFPSFPPRPCCSRSRSQL